MFDTIQEILNSRKVVSLFHQVLKETASSSIKKYDSSYMLILMDCIVNYLVVHQGKYQFDYYFNLLTSYVNNGVSKDNISMVSNYLIAFSVVERLGLSDPTKSDDKRQVLYFIYQNYIENGYLFYGFHPSFMDKIQIDGLVSNKMIYHKERLLKLASIYRKYKVDKNSFIRLDKNVDNGVTDSFSNAYIDSLSSPWYFSDIVATSSVMNDNKYFDREAYLKRDFAGCSMNLSNLCMLSRMPLEEQDEIMDLFNKEWFFLKEKDTNPLLAFIPRYYLEQNHLEQFNKIIELSDQEDIAISVSKILSAFPLNIRQYKKIPYSLMKFIKVPMYQEILDFKEESRLSDTTVIRELKAGMDKEKEVLLDLDLVHKHKKRNDYGQISIAILVCLLLFSLGCTVSIILRFFKLI